MAINTTLFLAVIVAAFAATDRSAQASQRDAPSHRTNLSKAEKCWKDGEEIENLDVRGRPPILLPERLWSEPVRIPAVRIKLCIDSAGKVVRAIQLRSSGNDKVDAYYRLEWSKRTFKPVVRGGRAVRSVATVATQWNPR